MDSSDTPLIWGVLFAAMLLLDFLLTGFNASLDELSESDLEDKKRDGDTKAGAILELIDHPHRITHTVWFYLVMTALPGAFAVISIDGLKRIPTVLILIALTYIFGKALPSLAGRRYCRGFSARLYTLVHVLERISFPFIWVLDLATWGLAWIIGIRRKDLEDEVTEEEIINMVNDGQEQGVLDEHEAEMIQNIFELDDKEARDIMTHRKNIQALDGEKTLAQAITFMTEQPNSRFPVYEENIDNILGVLHFKDAMIFHNRKDVDDLKIKDIPDLVRPVKFIPETRSINALFRSMQAQKMQMVIVVDEYGETAGLVTMEDILEEIVGNILDEYDKEEQMIVREGDDSWFMDGMAPLEDVEEALGVEFEEDDYDTLNGFLVSLLDRIPHADEKPVVTHSGYDFHILEVESNTIRLVRITKATEESDSHIEN